MKKNLFYYLFAVICSVTLFTSCSDDDDEKMVNPVPQTTFTGENGLQLTYNGAPMPGKKVTFTPDATNAQKATLRLEGEFDLNGILGKAKSAAAREDVSMPTAPGVLPGSPVVTLPVDLTINGDKCSFAGTSETDYCTFSYKGEVSAGAMELALSEVKLKNAKLAGMTWKLKPYDKEDPNKIDPIYLVWEAEKKVFDLLPIESVLKIALRMELIAAGADHKVSAAEMLGTVLQDVTFMEDGNIVATYKDAANGGTEWTKSPVNLAQYIVENDNQIKVFLNPAAIIAAVNNAGRAVDVQAVIQQTIQMLYPMLVNGVPVAFEQTEDALSVYLNTELLLPLLKTLVVPLLSDEEVVAMLVELMKKDPDFSEMADLAEPMLKAFPEIIESTTKVEIGLNFVK
ncbi:DUF4925 domain-containing protein [Phocaeicola vulgatus]|uniref:DUF4925 domain-containing protein n=1 Tax=Phocaeicola vulgatus TaxID=821 RepID=UPI000E4720DC|nr:DUF4925 domain-containing protein [Phocaeicola vulgatus]MBV3848797.1 DUF4925 domain-containing protein [Phocaeicola vulgatus]MBV3857835.1 DUF4925 domain-containing protein [Phocaeicola vulgatus]MBV3861937.1 DUF4925 domain-containing protein [Phocaeicola vulgatus]MBV3869416.1 DUF4925 domain-containing protein [Phocaeicola vulgatus]MBV3886951.1 DUF4925 domain-containing protein [Phocaeicola vulgatus]